MRERELWRKTWRLPQARVWELNSATLQVGMYVRTLAAAEERGAPTSLRTLVVNQERALLLTHDALTRAGFKVSSRQDSQLDPPVVQSVRRPLLTSSRGRLQAVPAAEGEK